MKGVNIQDSFLNESRRSHTSVTVFLTNGFQIKGVVRGFDQYVVMIDVMGKQNMIYKHAISTIIPQDNLKYQEKEDEN
jgi:host factor-I protein